MICLVGHRPGDVDTLTYVGEEACSANGDVESWADSLAMRIDRLDFENFKKFARQTLHLHPQFTLFVGENGAGKTTVLDALAVAAGVWLANPPDSMLANSGRNILTTEIRLEP